jgi:hypothetical protein
MDFLKLINTSSNSSNEEKWNDLWQSFKLSIKIEILIATFIAIAIYFNKDALNVLDDRAFFNSQNNNSFLYNLLFLFINAIIEELIFRLHIDFKRKHILVSLFISLFFLLHNLFIIQLLVIGNLLILFISSFFKSSYFENNRHFLSIYILVNSLIFAIAHTQNFSIINKNNFIVFILVLLIRMMNGVLLCRIRLRNRGLEWSIGLHIMLNFIPFFFAFIGTIKLR